MDLKALLDKAVRSRNPVIIKRRGHPDVALIAAAELRSLMETVYLLRSPANAERLLRALARAQGEKVVTNESNEPRLSGVTERAKPDEWSAEFLAVIGAWKEPIERPKQAPLARHSERREQSPTRSTPRKRTRRK